MLADDKNKEFTYLKRNLEEILNWSFLMCASCGELITIIWAAPLQFACHPSSAARMILAQSASSLNMLTCTLNRHISLQILHHFFAMINYCILFFGKITTKNICVYQMTIKPQMTLFLEYICVSRFWVLPAQYQILSSCPSLLYIHRGPMGIFNIRSQNFWVNQNEKCENILSIRSGSCAEKPPISEGELQWKMG